MKLAIFDVDGTLVNIHKIEEDCFVRTFAEEFGIVRINCNWSEYIHVTEPGIVSQIFQEKLGRIPSDKDFLTIKKHFLKLLQKACETHPNLFFEIPGSAKVISQLKVDSDWSIAIATGSWRDPALFKLEKADIEITGIPFVSGDDEFSREAIVKASIEKAKNLYQIENFKKIVSIGDGIWDIKTAAKLGISFVGIAKGREAEKLLNLGCDRVVENFARITDFKQMLETATIPRI
jgi:phosphoglycolate phosphatase-like HAD superfamily hydrolase